ncbi:hypothetical protein [Propionibacterium australiense]|uniref:hypothetical protein n=1 Tax=Propionibacterium australiense TaxID=119981 RepID=UPI000F838936|nr:hypothetical protein [Propionibacterium australiense]
MNSIDDAYPANYTVNRIDLPSGPVDYKINGVNWGVPLLVEPLNTDPYTMILPYSDFGYVSGLFTTPNPDVFLFAKGGTIILVDVLTPEDAEEIDQVFPVVEIIPIVCPARLVLISFQYIAAVGEKGQLAWATPKLADDGFRIDSTKEGKLTVTADWDWNPRTFRIDLLDGSIEACQ